jgi:SAM-dependent methyltransferase
MNKSPDIIKDHYNKCFLKHGDNYKGADWPNKEDLIKRYMVMSSVVKSKKKDDNPDVILDFGCGTGMFYEFLSKENLNLKYIGLDINKDLIFFAKEKYKNIDFYNMDILKDKNNFNLNYDYAICNGVFTEKLSLTNDEMFVFLKETITILFNRSNKGIAFNVMSGIVDFKRDDLFHLDINLLFDFLCKNLTRNFIIRNDYGLYEYTVYLYKEVDL